MSFVQERTMELEGTCPAGEITLGSRIKVTMGDGTVWDLEVFKVSPFGVGSDMAWADWSARGVRVSNTDRGRDG